MSSEPKVLYDERLYVPLRWWVQATMLLASFWLAFVVALPASTAWAATGVLGIGVVTLLLGYGAARVRLEDGVLYAGAAHIPVTMLTDPVVLDRDATRRVAGREADASAYLLLRPYLRRAVMVRVVDPSDPTPYWLVSTRRPEELARAIAGPGLS